MTDSPEPTDWQERRLDACLEGLLRHLEVAGRGTTEPGHSAKDHVGISTGLVDVDRIVGGLRPQTITVLGGRPGMGKTALALTLADHVVHNAGPVAYFALADTRLELAKRWLSGTAGVDSMRLRNGPGWEEPHRIWARLVDAAASSVGAPLYCFAGPTTADRIAGLCGTFDGDLALVIVDYLQMLSDPGTQQRADQLALYMRVLHDVAVTCQVPVLVVSQLSRSLESRPDRRPRVTDLRGSGAIEDTADVVLLLYRDDYYNPQSSDRGNAEIIIAKQRAGPTGVARVTFAAEHSRFGNLA